MRKGFSLIDLVLAIGIVVTLFGGIFLVYFSIIDTAFNYELRRAASNVLAEKVELVRNLPYEQVGVSGGIPAGILPASEQVDWDGQLFVVSAAVRAIDDPFDGTVTSTPRDTAPADYKLVEFAVACPTCSRFTPITLTTTVAPQGLESASQNGSLFISVFDANGQPVQGADVTIANASTSPAISFTDVTDAAGMLQLVDVPTSTQGYRVEVTKAGYSRERTYPQGGAGNPNPTKPDATVASQSVTALSFAIDRLTDVSVAASDLRCQAIAGAPFALRGQKLIGTGPDTYKLDISTTTPASGQVGMDLEWDTYDVTYSGGMDLVGTVPLAPWTIAPGGSQVLRLVLAPATRPALQVIVRDAVTGEPVEAQVTLSGAGDASGVAGTADYADDWSGGSYAAASNVTVGAGIRLSGPAYSTSTTGIFESQTIDLGGTPASLRRVSWSATAPGGTDVQFQVAGSDDGTSWDFVGPDGTSATYFTGAASVPSLVRDKRYVRYRAYLTTGDESVTPEVTGVTLEFAGPCVPPGQRLFPGLDSGTYTVSASASGYDDGNATVSVSGWKAVTVSLNPS